VSDDKYSTAKWQPFKELAETFLEKTQGQVLQGVNPGGIYQAFWCRDASYILMDWFLSGNIHGTMQQIHQIWSHQITSPSNEKIVYGRGSVDMKFLSEIYDDNKGKFKGALPTTIYQAGFSEVYGQSPDIDSTALMISATAWILAKCVKKQDSISESPRKASDTSDYYSGLLLKVGITDPFKVMDFVVPKMFSAVDYLGSRDIDDDGLLEQSHNEDWMDTILRAGKIVYSQACWILALSNFALLLESIGKVRESEKMSELAKRTINAVDNILWSEEDNSYVDIQVKHHIGGPYRTLMQDVSLYLIAAKGHLFRTDTEQENRINSNKVDYESSQRIHHRSLNTLDTMKKRLWKEGWPLVTEVELKSTGPWVLKPYQYHNRTIWPWCTALEILARIKFNQIDECTALLTELSSGQPYMFSFYEWINPLNMHPEGAFPFRTGISAVRLAISDILQQGNVVQS